MKEASDIKKTVLSFLPGAKVFLFGSRAKGNYNSSSDYDVLVITPENIPAKEKLDFTGKIRRALIKVLNAPVDILLNSQQEVATKTKLPGHIVKWAMKEGIEL